MTKEIPPLVSELSGRVFNLISECARLRKRIVDTTKFLEINSTNTYYCIYESDIIKCENQLVVLISEKEFWGNMLTLAVEETGYEL